MIVDLYDNLPRLIYIAFSLYSLVLVATRWHVTRVMTMERRFLLLFLVLECFTTIASGTLKSLSGVPADPSTWLTVLTQSFLGAYLHYSIPPQFRRFHHRWTRRPHKEAQ